MTPRQRELIDFISRFYDKHGFTPSYREMAAGLGVSSLSHIMRMLEALSEGGNVKLQPRRVRAVQLIKHDLCKLPTADLAAELQRRGFTVAPQAQDGSA